MSVEGKREGEVSIPRMIDKRHQHTVGVTLPFRLFRHLVQLTDMLTDLAKNGPRNVSIWLLRKIDVFEIVICRQPSGQRWNSLL